MIELLGAARDKLLDDFDELVGRVEDVKGMEQMALDRHGALHVCHHKLHQCNCMYMCVLVYPADLCKYALL